MRTFGEVESIGVSGKVWTGFKAGNLSDMLFDELRRADRAIQICSFATGHKSPVMETFFSILKEQLENPQMRINMIINDHVNGKTVTPYARNMIHSLQDRFPDRFFPQYFAPRHGTRANRILHAKITVIDGRIALIGSANLSKGALESNYEIMLKVTGQAAVDLSAMLSQLSLKMGVGKA